MMSCYSGIALLLLISLPLMIHGKVCPHDEALDCYDDNIKDGDGCKPGEANYTLHEYPGSTVQLPWLAERISPEGYHCDCKVGYTGLKCFRKFDICTNERAAADKDDNKKIENMCYNSGSCVAGVFDEFGNKQHYCDCSAAKLSNKEGGQKTIGKYCTDKVNQCKEGHALGTFFCLNGANCHTDTDGNLVHDKPCNNCKGDFVGTHCEFSSQEMMDQPCNLPCNTANGKCVRGFKDFHQARMMFNQEGFFEEDDYMYCRCKDGYDGPYCDQSLSKNTASKTSCGNEEGKSCQHGGKCVPGLEDKKKEVCDCTNAKNATHQFGGQYCEHASSDKCNSADKRSQIRNGKLFCYNGGTCDAQGSHLPCKCDKGTTGATCEINVGQGENVTQKCNLKCENDGKCRFGTKDTSVLSSFGPDLEKFNQTHIDMKHCVCPEGYVGAKCEFKVDICGSGEHICFHGSKCVKDSKESSGYSCDCTNARQKYDPTGKVYSGKFCHKGEGEDSSSNKNPAIDARPSTTESNNKSGNSPFAKFLISVIVILAVCLAALFFLKAKRQRQMKRLETARRDKNANIAPAYHDEKNDNGNGAPVLDMGPAKDIDGNTFDNVEII